MSTTVDQDVLVDELLSRYSAYEKVWEKYMGPPDDWPKDQTFYSRSYTQADKQDFIRTIAAIDRAATGGGQ